MSDDPTEWGKDEVWCYERLGSRIRAVPDCEVVRFCELVAAEVALGAALNGARQRAFKEVFG
jgi:hypothetical protein